MYRSLKRLVLFGKFLKAGIGKKRLILRVPGKLYLDL